MARKSKKAQKHKAPFDSIPANRPIKWPLYEQWAIDVAGGDKWLSALVLRVEVLLGRRVKGRHHGKGPFIELQIAPEPADLPGLQPTVMYLVDKLRTGGHPFGALAVSCGRLFLAPPVLHGRLGVLWGHTLIEGEQTHENLWRGHSWS